VAGIADMGAVGAGPHAATNSDVARATHNTGVIVMPPRGQSKPTWRTALRSNNSATGRDTTEEPRCG